MKIIKVKNESINKRVDRFLMEEYNNLSKNILFKAFRKKDIKVNGKWIKENYLLQENDVISIFLDDKYFELSNILTQNNIIFEDENLLILNKPQGISVNENKSLKNDKTLIDIVKDYTKNDSIYLCHRLDRNTGGLILLAKKKEVLDIIIDKMNKSEIKKQYLCKVYGKLPKSNDILTDYLKKDSNKSLVYISNQNIKGSQIIKTGYNVVSFNPKENTSILEVDLYTGRTHQIRAHLAFIGNPIIGDGKYGSNEINKKFKVKFQQLYSYKLIFNFSKEKSILDYLKNKEFTLNMLDSVIN